MRVSEVIHAWGHAKIRATHATTLEVTKESQLTHRGNCIIGVSASKAARDLSQELRNLAQNDSATICLTLKAGNLSETITGRGHPGLSLDHPTDLVVRRSAYACSRTIMLRADKASLDLSRDFVRVIRDPNAEITVILQAQLEP